jgi:hypothetical protein
VHDWNKMSSWRRRDRRYRQRRVTIATANQIPPSRRPTAHNSVTSGQPASNISLSGNNLNQCVTANTHRQNTTGSRDLSKEKRRFGALTCLIKDLESEDYLTPEQRQELRFYRAALDDLQKKQAGLK